MRILVVDLSSVLHTVKHGLGKAKLKHNEKHTFVIFGFFMKMRIICMKVNPDVVVFACDDKESQRKDIFPDYKGKRTNTVKTPEQIELTELAFPQFIQIQEEILPKIGYNNIIQLSGLEADDIIARVTKKYLKKGHTIAICTSDEDMYQLLDEKVAIIKPRTLKWYTRKDFVSEYKIEPPYWRNVKVYGGCTSDSVPGILIPQGEKSTSKQRRIGEGFALKYLHGKLNPETNTGKAFRLESNKEIIELNKKLVVLPFKTTPDIVLKRDRLSRKEFHQICKELSFKSIIEDFEDFCKLLKIP